MPLELQLLTAYWALLEMEAITGPGLVTLNTQLLSMPRVLETVSCKLGMATEIFLKLSGTYRIVSNMGFLAYPTCQMPPCWKSSSLSQTSWLSGGTPWNQLSEEQMEFMHFMDGSTTISHVGACWRTFLFLNQNIPDKG